ncbi:MAG: sterol desaturase family protein [Flavobacterium sp.]|nr:sterol desaturase family protein [Pedobacter sp.]
MEIITEVFDKAGAAILATFFILFYFAESQWPLRHRVQKRWQRILINVAVAIPSFALLRLLLITTLVWLAIINQDIQFGLNYLYDAPAWIKGFIAFLVLDYSNYLWHVVNHKIPFLWRFHLVHHTDHDLDLSTAIRFHFGELILSVFFRGLAVFLIGASPLTVLVYEIVFETATQFHHTNMRLPLRFEKTLNKLLVTPRMHGIHHSVIRHETDSNYAVIFSFWDRMHRTVRLNIPQNDVKIGVAVYPDKKELTTWYLLKLPFTAVRGWKDEERKVGLKGEKKEMKF